ncbi:DUF6300 family protein [Nonomuraea dietziae]|uniref:DUF6300 family protein n=1 Tax=Nonomuraea dietziae TaxID=65515 RepID=UPI0031D4FB71
MDIISSDRTPPCPRCGQEGLLQARVPHGWVNASGALVQGRNGVVLCATCDADQPHAAALITWFHVNGQVEVGAEHEFKRLLVAWAEHVHVPLLDERALTEEAALWQEGEL